MFDVEIYPNISDKAALYMFNIISNHIFQDGNKRTGLEAAIFFLDINGFRIDKNLNKELVYEFTMSTASGELTLSEVQDWFEKHIVEEYL